MHLYLFLSSLLSLSLHAKKRISLRQPSVSLPFSFVFFYPVGCTIIIPPIFSSGFTRLSVPIIRMFVAMLRFRPKKKLPGLHMEYGCNLLLKAFTRLFLQRYYSCCALYLTEVLL